MTDGYSIRELNIMETRMAEQELEIVRLQLKVQKIEGGEFQREALRILRKIDDRRGSYITKEIENEIRDLLEEVDHG